MYLKEYLSAQIIVPLFISVYLTTRVIISIYIIYLLNTLIISYPYLINYFTLSGFTPFFYNKKPDSVRLTTFHITMILISFPIVWKHQFPYLWLQSYYAIDLGMTLLYNIKEYYLSYNRINQLKKDRALLINLADSTTI
jgi:hypothetical protein